MVHIIILAVVRAPCLAVVRATIFIKTPFYTRICITIFTFLDFIYIRGITSGVTGSTIITAGTSTLDSRSTSVFSASIVGINIIGIIIVIAAPIIVPRCGTCSNGTNYIKEILFNNPKSILIIRIVLPLKQKALLASRSTANIRRRSWFIGSGKVRSVSSGTTIPTGTGTRMNPPIVIVAAFAGKRVGRRGYILTKIPCRRGTGTIPPIRFIIYS